MSMRRALDSNNLPLRLNYEENPIRSVAVPQQSKEFAIYQARSILRIFAPAQKKCPHRHTSRLSVCLTPAGGTQPAERKVRPVRRSGPQALLAHSSAFSAAVWLPSNVQENSNLCGLTVSYLFGPYDRFDIKKPRPSRRVGAVY